MDTIAKLTTESDIVDLETNETGCKLTHRTIFGDRYVNWFDTETEAMTQFIRVCSTVLNNLTIGVI